MTVRHLEWYCKERRCNGSRGVASGVGVGVGGRGQ